VGAEALAPERRLPIPDADVQSAVLSAIAAGRAAGAGRAFLTGLWLAAVSTLVEAGDPADVMALLLDRTCAIRGHGRNADAPPLQEDDEARTRRSGEAALAARAIVDALMPLPVSAADDFPERFLDVAVALLVEAWGPAHVRRALWEQRAALEEGSEAVILPTEPAASNGAARPRPAPEPVRPPLVPPVAVSVPGLPRHVEVHADAAMLDGGAVAYALCARIRRGDARESREVTGLARGASLRRTVLQALSDLVRTLPPTAVDHLRVATPIEGVLRLAEGADPQGDEVCAELLAGLRDGRVLEWAPRSNGLATELGRRCDRALRDRVDEEGADAA
jgi:hypothetical protein